MSTKFDSTYSAVVSMAEQLVGEGKYDSTYSAVLAIYQNLTSDVDTKFDSVYSIVVKIADGIESGEIDLGGGGESNFSKIYDNQSVNKVEQNIDDDIDYTKSKEKAPTNDVSNFYKNDTKLVYAPQYFNNGDLFGAGTSLMISLYEGCTRLQYIPMIDTSSVQNMSSMFYNCSGLPTIPLLDTSSVTTMSYMFYNCSALTTIPQLDTSNVTDMRSMFYNCSGLITIPLLDTSSVTNMSYMFSDCSGLITIPSLDTSSVIEVNNMFYKAYGLVELPLLDFGNMKYLGSLFGYSNDYYNLTMLRGFKDVGKSFPSTSSSNNQTLDISLLHNLTHESLMNVINNLYDLNLNGKYGGLVLGSTNRAKLTEDEIAIATNKGWTVS